MSTHRTNYKAGRYRGDLADIDGHHWRYLFTRALGLTGRETRVLAFMASEAEWEYVTPWCERTICLGATYIAAATGVTVGNLQGSGGVIASLITKGWIEKVRPHNAHHPAHYELRVGDFRIVNPEVIPDACY